MTKKEIMRERGLFSTRSVEATKQTLTTDKQKKDWDPGFGLEGAKNNIQILQASSADVEYTVAPYQASNPEDYDFADINEALHWFTASPGHGAGTTTFKLADGMHVIDTAQYDLEKTGNSFDHRFVFKFNNRNLTIIGSSSDDCTVTINGPLDYVNDSDGKRKVYTLFYSTDSIFKFENFTFDGNAFDDTLSDQSGEKGELIWSERCYIQGIDVSLLNCPIITLWEGILELWEGKFDTGFGGSNYFIGAGQSEIVCGFESVKNIPIVFKLSGRITIQATSSFENISDKLVDDIIADYGSPKVVNITNATLINVNAISSLPINVISKGMSVVTDGTASLTFE